MAGVIRKEKQPRTGAFSFADLEQQGRAIVERARTQAGEIIAAARRAGLALGERERRRAHDEGVAAGRAAGLAQIRAEAHAAALREAQQNITQLAAALRAALVDFDQHKRDLIATAESALIELALQIARRVCKLEAGESTAAALANARSLLDTVQHAENVELCFNPAEFELLRETAAQLTSAAQACSHLELVCDESVQRGGCRLRTRAGQIDANLEVQLQRIAAALRVSPEEIPAAVPAGAPVPHEASPGHTEDSAPA